MHGFFLFRFNTEEDCYKVLASVNIIKSSANKLCVTGLASLGTWSDETKACSRLHKNREPLHDDTEKIR